MKILFISMPSLHVSRWIENLNEAGFELFWFDVLGRGELSTTNKNITQFYDWKKDKRPFIKGKYFLSKKLPKFYSLIRPFLEITENQFLEKIILEIQPDVIHSFEMQGCSYPILKTMNQHTNIKWIYSCWGSDLFYYQNDFLHKQKIEKVLSRVNFLFTDCYRDVKIAQKLGFKGISLGVIPGGNGYDISHFEPLKTPINERKIILVKGYQHQFGRALNVIKALEKLDLLEYEVILFGAHQEIIDYVAEKKYNWKVFHRNELSHNQVIELMGKSLIYIGNSISDGMPNTLLEAILMSAFPIQSNPGNVTAEIIEDGKNGFLIHDPENCEEINLKVKSALTNRELLKNAAEINKKIAIEKLEYNANKEKIIISYKSLMSL